MVIDRTELASRIDHTLLRPDATRDDIVQLCREALTHGFHAVCIHPCWVRLAHDLLMSSTVGVCTVIGFPSGAHRDLVKAFETEIAVGDGADELDVVLALGRLKRGENDEVRRELEDVVSTAQGRTVKAILETGLLSTEEIVRACTLAREAGARFVKTSTGFGPRGASVQDVQTMRAAVGDALGVKASGGIADAATARAMLAAGATRLGTSAALAILSEWIEDPRP